jgi:hypothetical protein
VVAATLFIDFLSLLDQHESGSTGQPFASLNALSTKIYVRAGHMALWWIFSMDSQTLNKISIDSALRMSTSKGIGN